jgi:predicted transcriptional regulator
MPQISENITVRMPPKMAKKLDVLAVGLDRSRNWLINQAIDNYLEVYEWQTARIRERLGKSRKGGKFKTSNHVDALVESFKP